MNQITEQSWANIVARFDGMAAQADDAEQRLDGYLAGAQAELPALNVLKNAGATERDGAGGFLSPLNIYIGGDGNTTIATQRVIEHDDPEVPADISSKLNSANLFGFSYNCIEVTLSQNGGSGQFRLIAFARLRGQYTGGVMYAQASADGITLVGTPVPTDVAAYNLSNTTHTFHNVNALNGFVVGEAKRLYLCLPYVCAGRVSAPPLFLNSDVFHLGELID